MRPPGPCTEVRSGAKGRTPGARRGAARTVALGLALALALLLLAAREAEAAKYEVAQCGWHLGADASWADTTGGAKFRPDAYCAAPAGADPFDGVHMKSFTTAAATVSGTRFARWRWDAPPGTAITRVSGTWWQALHDGLEQRIGSVPPGGGFAPFALAAATNVAPRGFVAGFSPGQAAIEDRLLCARGESKWCGLSPGSWSAVRGLTITVEDPTPPAAGVDGELVAPGWKRGAQGIGFWGNDAGAGVRFGETLLDGHRVALAEYPCAKAIIGGEWRGTRMQPCLTVVSGGATVATTGFSDGPHSLGHCATDFAGNVSCVAPRTVSIDNNPPAHPRGLSVAGGEGWHRRNDFDLSWANPGQGAASPIWGAFWRIAGPAGFDGGAQLAPGRDVAAIPDRAVPGPGAYAGRVWLRDEAGNSDPGTAVEVALRYDPVAPGVAFEATGGPAVPDAVRARVSDAHSGPAAGTIRYRRLGGERWLELPTRLSAGEAPGDALLTAPLPGDLAPGIYAFRAEAVDRAGNSASSSKRADGTEMAIRIVAAATPAHRASPARARSKTRLFARLRRGRRRGARIAVPFAAAAKLSGRLATAGGAGLAGRRLRVVSRPSRGAHSRRRVDRVRTGRHGGFRLRLPPGTSRRVTVAFRGDAGLAGARRAGLVLRVRGGVLLHAAPRSLPTGRVLHLWGRVRSRGAPLPRRGKLVAIQYRERETGRWRPVLFARSDHGGRFRARYRFRYVSGVARIRLRAVALAEERWPYAPGASEPLTVRVRG